MASCKHGCTQEKKEDGLQHKGNEQYSDSSMKNTHLGHAKILLGSTNEICV